jgi:uncharacterized protein YrrD
VRAGIVEREDAMREGSYTQIERGMRVVGRDGETIGAVHEVVADEASGIFVGLAVRPNLFTHALMVPGEKVDRLHDNVVYVDTVQDELQPYNTPAERHHDTEQAYQGVTS